MSWARFILSYFLHSHGLLLSLLGLLTFEPVPFTNSFLWAPLAYFCFLSISYDTHGLTISFFGASLTRLLALEPLCYFVGLWNIIPTIWTLMVFTLLIFLSSPIFHIVGLFLSLGPFAKMGINIQPPEHMNYSYGSYMNQKKKKRFFF